MLDPILLFFILGFVASLFKSDLKIPPEIYDLLSILLLLAIGMKGGIEIAKQSSSDLLPQVSITLLIGFLIPVLLYPILKFLVQKVMPVQ